MGADLARWGKMAEMLVRLVSPSSFVDSNNALVKALEKNSETLQNITESFLGISRDFRIFFFWEELKTSIAGMGRELVSVSCTTFLASLVTKGFFRSSITLRLYQRRIQMLVVQLSMQHIAICASSTTKILRAGMFWPAVCVISLNMHQVSSKEVGLRNSDEMCWKLKAT